jgi:hypothetical protein
MNRNTSFRNIQNLDDSNDLSFWSLKYMIPSPVMEIFKSNGFTTVEDVGRLWATDYKFVDELLKGLKQTAEDKARLELALYEAERYYQNSLELEIENRTDHGNVPTPPSSSSQGTESLALLQKIAELERSVVEMKNLEKKVSIYEGSQEMIDQIISIDECERIKKLLFTTIAKLDTKKVLFSS